MRLHRLVVRGLMLPAHWYLYVLMVFAVSACAQGNSAHLEYIKYIPIAGKDPASTVETIPEFAWSPLSLAWSPDGKRIAFAAASMRPFGVVDVETKRVTPIQTAFRGEGRVLWSKNLNWLVIEQKTAFSVYDMSAEVPQLRYTVQNNFPQVLQVVGADIVTVKGEDFLVLVGDTTWRRDPTNPHVVAYELRTGVRKWSYQVKLVPSPAYVNVDDQGIHPSEAAAAVDTNGDIWVAIYAREKLAQKRITKKGTTESHEDALWVLNLTQQSMQCHIRLYEPPEVQKDEFDNPWGGIHSLLFNPTGSWFVVSHTQFTNIFSPQTCSITQKLEVELKEGVDQSMKAGPHLDKQKPGVTRLTVSPNGTYLFGSSYWAPKPSHAPFRLWLVEGWKQLVDQTYADNGAVHTSAFSADEKMLAFATSNRITIYRVR